MHHIENKPIKWYFVPEKSCGFVPLTSCHNHVFKIGRLRLRVKDITGNDILALTRSSKVITGTSRESHHLS